MFDRIYADLSNAFLCVSECVCVCVSVCVVCVRERESVTVVCVCVCRVCCILTYNDVC